MYRTHDQNREGCRLSFGYINPESDFTPLANFSFKKNGILRIYDLLSFAC